MDRGLYTDQIDGQWSSYQVDDIVIYENINYICMNNYTISQSGGYYSVYPPDKDQPDNELWKIIEIL